MNAPKMPLRRSIAATALGLAIAGGMTAPAHAGTTAQGNSSTAAAAARPSSGSESAAGAAACRQPITAWGYTGYRMCGTGKQAWIDWNRDGRTDEVFVIAPNRTIWHTWKSAGRWVEMPGNGRADKMMGAAETGNPNRRCVIVYVYNASYHYWQNCFYSGRWHDWGITG